MEFGHLSRLLSGKVDYRQHPACQTAAPHCVRRLAPRPVRWADPAPAAVL